MSNMFPQFDQPIPDNGYSWWYVDAISDDGEHALTIIAMLGNVFSPYYAWARESAAADPLNYCAMNVVLYGKKSKRWAMTERLREDIKQTSISLTIGPSSMHSEDGQLRILVNETTVSIPTYLQGEIVITPTAMTGHTEQLDSNGQHWWSPVAPCSRAEVRMEQPALCWDGGAYFDHNRGSAPLEQDFEYWDWSRAPYKDHTAIIYDVTRRDGTRTTLALDIDKAGKVENFTPGIHAQLDTTSWQVKRSTFSDNGKASIVETLEDTPFYSRSLLETEIAGNKTTAMHESLSLDRFKSRWVQCLLPFRMPRRRWKG